MGRPNLSLERAIVILSLAKILVNVLKENEELKLEVRRSRWIWRARGFLK